jgi:hypothetical protein
VKNKKAPFLPSIHDIAVDFKLEVAQKLPTNFEAQFFPPIRGKSQLT